MTRNASTLSSEKPLLGAVLCCTSITPEQRTQIADYAEQMGAEHKLDLTSDVTHLLVGLTDTPKYQYVAREREDVKVLRPEWVEAVRECWMEDKSMDMNALEAEYRLPTLAGLKICITGFDDLKFRADLQHNVITNGGEYTGDLTKDVTHLIAAKPEGKKYEYATLWQKKVVSIRWYKDTLDRGMQLDESSYHPSRPVEQQGIGAWNRQEKNNPKSTKRLQDDPPTQEPARKLRRTASAKLGSQTDNIWGDIFGQNSEQSTTNRDILRPSRSMPVITEHKEQPSESLAHEQQNLHRTSGALVNEGAFLRNLYFVVLNFDKKRANLVRQALQGAGAEILDAVTELVTNEETSSENAFLIVPHRTRQGELPHLGSSTLKPKLVTELWLERCMLQKDFISPQQYPLGGIISEITSPDVDKFVLNATGFQSIETLHISKTTELTGAKYAEVFNSTSSVLVCNTRNINQQKLYHAKQWNIPAVSEKWLCEFLTSGQLPRFDDYLIEKQDHTNDLQNEINQKRREARKDLPDRSQRGDNAKPSTSQEQGLEVNTQNANGQQPFQERQTVNDKGQPTNRSSKQSSRENTALREISPNSPSKKAVPPAMKKQLFRTYDGTGGQENKSAYSSDLSIGTHLKPVSPVKSGQDAESINSAIQDLLNMKVKAKANAAAGDQEPKSKKKRLLGRALSNLSNASHGSHHSRASSVDSLNTDGIGSEIAPPSGRSSHRENAPTESKRGSLQGRGQTNSFLTAQTASVDLSDPRLLRDEFDAKDDAPQLTQLGYEDSEEAVALREKLAEKKRARTRARQDKQDPKSETRGKEKDTPKERKVIKDDEVLNSSGWGAGRRTRAKNRSVEMTGLDIF